MRQHPAPDQLLFQPMTNFKALPPASELWELFDYKPLTGELIRRSKDAAAGTPTTKGYLHITISQVKYAAHRLAWKWVTAQEPEVTVDHRNHNKADNGWHNLRLATGAQQAQNRRYRGTWRAGKKWMAQVQVNGVRHRLGPFTTEAEARVAYEEASKRLHGKFSAVY